MATKPSFLLDTNVVAYAYDRSEVVQEAVRGVVEHKFNYWDAQIWATARLNQIPIVLSEDFSHDHRVEGVHFVNPFAPGVELPL